MNKTLLKSVREYKKQSVLAPFFVILEVLMEVLIPMEMAKIIDVGIMQGNLSYIIRRGLILVIMAMLALYFGILAGFGVGDLLYQYILAVVPPDEVMFNPALCAKAFVIPAILIAVITFILGYIMNRKLKYLDMLSALKSVE